MVHDVDGHEHQRGHHEPGNGHLEGSQAPKEYISMGSILIAKTMEAQAQHGVKKYSGSETQCKGNPNKSKDGTGVGAREGLPPQPCHEGAIVRGPLYQSDQPKARY